jgi:deoxyribonuclease-4
MSIAGGLENAFAAGVAAGCDCLQIFVKNQRQWTARPLGDDAIERYKSAERESGLRPVVAHATYLINPASPDTTNRRRSLAALIDETDRCVRLGVPYLVLHPGAHMGEGVDAGVRRIVRTLNELHRRTAADSVRVLLETTAGQGSSIGHEAEHLGRIIDAVREPDRLGVCVDTCHVFAAGYDIRKEEGYGKLVDELRDHVGLERVCCIHVNDSKGLCGGRLDRHEHIGKGEIGKAGFRNLLSDPRFANVPKILETPKGKDGRGTDLDRVNLKRLRGLVE